MSINRFRYLYIPAHENIHTAVVLIQISSCILCIGHWLSPVRSCLYWKCGEFSLIALYAMNLQSTTCSLSIYLLSTVMSLILSSFQCKFCLLDYSRVCPMGSVVPVYERYSIPFWEKNTASLKKLLHTMSYMYKDVVNAIFRDSDEPTETSGKKIKGLKGLGT